MKDRTTACNSAACQFWPVITIEPNSVYPIDFGGVVVTGLQWSCSAAIAVVGQIKGAYVR